MPPWPTFLRTSYWPTWRRTVDTRTFLRLLTGASLGLLAGETPMGFLQAELDLVRHPCTAVCPGLATMMAPGGTPSVIPVKVATYARRPPTRTFSDVEPGKVETTAVHGFEAMVGGWVQPTIGAPTKSGSH